MTQKGNIKNLKELKHSEMPVDLAASWDAVASALDAGKRKRFLLGWLTAASILIGLGIGSYLFIKNHDTNVKADSPDISLSSNPKTDVGNNSNLPSPGNNAEDINKNEGNAQPTIDNSDRKASPESGKLPISLPEDNVKIPSLQHEYWSLTGKYLHLKFKSDHFVPELIASEFKFTGPVEEKDKEAKNKGITGWELYAGTSPSLVNKLTQESKELGWRINRRFDEVSRLAEKTSAGYQFNAGVQMNLGNHFYIQSGFNYSEKQEWVKYNHTLTDFTIVRETEKKLEYAPMSPQQWVRVNFESTNRYRFAEIPLMLGVKFNAGEKLEWRARGGVSYWRLLGKTGGKIDPTSLLVQDLQELKNYRNNNIGVALNTGIYFKLNPQWSIMAEPSGSLSLSNLTMNAPIETRPYQYGLNFGVQYKLK